MTATAEHGGAVGWPLGVLLRAYHVAATDAIGDFPHGPRGYQVLATVVGDDQPSQLALAEYLSIDRTVMVYLIDDLVAAGMVERQPNPQDRRQKRVVATAKGKRTLADLDRRVAEAEHRVLAALDADERDTFRTLLRRLADDLHAGVSDISACEVAEQVLADP